ncbi:hypothetical protein OH82_00152 [Azospirillum brasilense]|nr:hypothetical protein OH82_00152 [Azospirillum brasilense]
MAGFRRVSLEFLAGVQSVCETDCIECPVKYNVFLWLCCSACLHAVNGYCASPSAGMGMRVGMVEPVSVCFTIPD